MRSRERSPGTLTGSRSADRCVGGEEGPTDHRLEFACSGPEVADHTLGRGAARPGLPLRGPDGPRPRCLPSQRQGTVRLPEKEVHSVRMEHSRAAR